MSKEALKLALDDLMAEYCMERTSFAKRVDEIFKQALAAAVQDPVAKYIGECSEVSLVQLYEDVKKGTNFYTTPPAQPAPEQYAALEQALTRLQKRYGELESRLAAQPATEDSSVVEPEPVQPVAWPCVISEADFQKNTVTLEMQCSDYKVGAGQHWLHTTPPATQRQLVRLSDEELAEIAMQSGAYDEQLLAFARAIEAAHGIKEST